MWEWKEIQTMPWKGICINVRVLRGIKKMSHFKSDSLTELNLAMDGNLIRVKIIK